MLPRQPESLTTLFPLCAVEISTRRRRRGGLAHHPWRERSPVPAAPVSIPTNENGDEGDAYCKMNHGYVHILSR